LAFYYIGERNFDAAERFAIAIKQDLKQLVGMPGMGAMREFSNPRLAGIRTWPVKGFNNYLIVYRATSQTFEFLALIHGARDIESALLKP
jgi:toxin ParE1/3/4